MTFSDDTECLLRVALVDALPAQLCLLDGGGRIVLANRAWRDFAESCLRPGDAEASLVRHFESLPGRDEKTVRALIQGIQAVLRGEEERLTLRYALIGDSGMRWYELTAAPFERAETTESSANPEEQGVLILQREITAEKCREDARKLQSLENLAGGVAHDFNNFLTGILGYADLAQLSLTEDSPVRNHLEHLRLGGKRAAALTQQLLAYSGKGPMHFRPLRLSVLVERVVRDLRTSIPASCSLRCDLAPELPGIEADTEQIEEIVRQLVGNAVEAIGDKDGTISVTTGRLECREEDLAMSCSGQDLPGGTYVFVEVVDTGAGIPSELQSQIFDPFFTTKSRGRGLGLAVARGMARAHHGTLELISRPGRGSRFRILLPHFD